MSEGLGTERSGAMTIDEFIMHNESIILDDHFGRVNALIVARHQTGRVALLVQCVREYGDILSFLGTDESWTPIPETWEFSGRARKQHERT